MAPHTQVLVSPSGQGILKNDRRASKPLMEKRRRERINKSLNELKTILLDALRKDSTCHSKLEKADILEMTVRYLKSIHRQRLSAAMPVDPAMLNNYRTGFVECKAEVSSFLDQSPDSFPRDVKTRLMSHLGTSPTYPNLVGGSQLMTATPPIANGTCHRAVPIQLTTNTQIRAMAAAAASLVSESEANAFLPATCQRIASMNSGNNLHGRAMNNVVSPPVSPIHNRHGNQDPLFFRKRSAEYDSSFTQCESKHRKGYSTSPHVETDSHHSVVGKFVVMPNFSSYSPPLQQVPSSPYSYSDPCRESPKSLSLSPASSTHSTSPLNDRTEFFKSHIKSERQSPSPSYENGDCVWRPW